MIDRSQCPRNRVVQGLAFLVLCLLLLVGCAHNRSAFGPAGANGPQVTTVYVVRHAEKQDGSDPGLTTRGQQRAQALAEMLGDDDIAAVFATEYLRTKQTVGPLARALGLPIQQSVAAKPEDLAEYIVREYAGAAVVVAAHSNTVPRLLTALGVREKLEIADKEYGDLFVVVRRANGSVDFSRHRFGD